MDYILFGMQGSGKGTQGKILAEKYNLEIFETGGALRSLAKKDTDLGKKVKNIIEAGHLVSNKVVMEIVEDFMNAAPEGKNILFDGIPREKEQAEDLNALLEKHDRDYTGIIIEISEEEAIKRLTTRRICETCKNVYPAFYKKNVCEICQGKLITRADDIPKSIQARIDAYKKETVPVINAYKKAGKMIIINGEQSIEKVTKEMLGSLRKF